MIKIYNYLFYRLNKSTASVNKFHPEVATIIFLSALLALNVFTVLVFFNVSFEVLTRNKMYIILTVILLFNFQYFLKRYEQINSEFENYKVLKVIDYLIFLYPFISFFLLFRILEVNNTITLIALGILLLVEIYAYFDKH